MTNSKPTDSMTSHLTPEQIAEHRKEAEEKPTLSIEEKRALVTSFSSMTQMWSWEESKRKGGAAGINQEKGDE